MYTEVAIVEARTPITRKARFGLAKYTGDETARGALEGSLKLKKWSTTHQVYSDNVQNRTINIGLCTQMPLIAVDIGLRPLAQDYLFPTHIIQPLFCEGVVRGATYRTLTGYLRRTAAGVLHV